MERERERRTDRQTDRQTDKERERERGRQKKRKNGIKNDRNITTENNRHKRSSDRFTESSNNPRRPKVSNGWRHCTGWRDDAFGDIPS